jgi:shikimate dehydrogenase
MATSGRTKLLGVLGHPVSHSLSPVIHSAFFDAAGIDAAYLPLDVAPGDLDLVFRGLRALGFVGLSVTYPHKVAVASLVDEIDERARTLGAVNTVVLAGTAAGVHASGHNTDGDGLCRYVASDLGLELARRPVVVLGAGAAAKSFLLALADRGPGPVTVVNRSQASLEAPFFDRLSMARLERVSLERRPDAARRALEAAGLVVHATPWGLGGHASEPCPWPLEALPASAVVVDLNYVPQGKTPLLEQLPTGVAGHDGVGMLVHQAALAFRLWFGVDAQVSAGRRALLSGFESLKP